MERLTRGLDMENNIKMDLKEIGYDVVDWILLAQGRIQWRVLVKTAVNLRVQYKMEFISKRLITPKE
jgi:hypothetical protein